MSEELIKVTINGTEYEAEKGRRLIEVCNEHGSNIPSFCYYSDLEVQASCRMCLVRIDKMPKLQTSCTINVTDGMVVTTDSEEIEKARRAMSEFLLANHPLDCPVCDRGGECDLQETVMAAGSIEERFSEPKNRFDEKFLFNYATVKMIPEIQRTKGVARAQILGSRRYAMRVWLNPDRMRAYNISTEDVMKAIGEQSIIGRPGRIGQSSGIEAQSLEYVLTYKGRYNKPEEYKDIIIRANSNGESIHLRDIAKVELGSEFFDIYSNLDGHASAAIVLRQNYGSNAREVIDEVKEGEMPLSSYTIIHSNAKLTAEEKATLTGWAQSIMDTMKAKYPMDSLVKKKK